MDLANLVDQDVLAVLVYGRVFSDCSADVAEALSKRVRTLGMSRKLPLILVPAGDFSEPDTFPDTVVIGIELTRAEASQEEQGCPSGDPQEVSPEQLAKAKRDLAAIAGELWKLAEENDLAAETRDDDRVIEGAILTACGPLAAAWARMGGDEVQVSADGQPWELLAAQGTVEVQAQYD